MNSLFPTLLPDEKIKFQNELIMEGTSYLSLCKRFFVQGKEVDSVTFRHYCYIKLSEFSAQIQPSSGVQYDANTLKNIRAQAHAKWLTARNQKIKDYVEQKIKECSVEMAKKDMYEHRSKRMKLENTEQKECKETEEALPSTNPEDPLLQSLQSMSSSKTLNMSFEFQKKLQYDNYLHSLTSSEQAQLFEKFCQPIVTNAPDIHIQHQQLEEKRIFDIVVRHLKQPKRSHDSMEQS